MTLDYRAPASDSVNLLSAAPVAESRRSGENATWTPGYLQSKKTRSGFNRQMLHCAALTLALPDALAPAAEPPVIPPGQYAYRL